jgi:hypothetical protein
MGISEGAVRKRVTRGTLKHEKDADGRVYVYLDAGGRQGVDAGQDEGVDPNSSALISQLRDEIAYLRDENRRKDEIIMQQAMTMRQLSAAPSQEPSEDAEMVEEADSAYPKSATAEAQDELGAERARREMAETTLHEGMAEQRRRREEAERERDDLRRELHARGRQQETHEAAEEHQGRGQPQSAPGGAQEGAQRRPWWKRVFRG